VLEIPCSKSQGDPEVGNTWHFENGSEAGLKFFADGPLVGQPGTHFNYSTQGYTLVGCAIEGASGEKYADYVREHVLVHHVDSPNAVGWARTDGLRAWVATWNNGRRGRCGHGGTQQGTSTMMLIAPDARAGVVVLANSDAAGASELASKLLKIVLGLPLGNHKEIAMDPKLYYNYVGSYEVTSVVIHVVREGDHLFTQINGQKNEIFPVSVRDCFSKAFDYRITFVSDGNGRASELIMHEGGIDLTAIRIK
jgi:hypothetical protein